ncbi:hypothetical protein [Aquimarina algicola]|uniref:Uncharacterized protein n=1 Tax=Aquimarina algicola TaxID=2589995 RepID=A0A504J946_9FLAO|nr:hypothetical protein [Aquimarina algicola]TPN87134.1 hypothetical protein FHK87_05955 [Aquimarina algicola]
MIDYPIDIDELETSEYDPFLHHVIRHKLRKKKNRRRLGRLIRKHPKARILNAVGIGRRRRRTRPVRRPVRTLDKRYRRPIGRPFRNRMVSRPRTIKKPFRRPPIKFGNPIHRDLEGISKIGIRKPVFKGTPIMPGDPRKRTRPSVSIPNKRKKPKVSRDIVIPYKRRYGSRKRRSTPIMRRRTPKGTIPLMEEELPIVAENMSASNMEVMDRNGKEKKPEKTSNKRKRQNIIGVAVLGLVVTGFVMYKMKTKIEANGRTS